MGDVAGNTPGAPLGDHLGKLVGIVFDTFDGTVVASIIGVTQ